MSKDEAMNVVNNMLSEHQTTMLVTHDKQGGLVSRPMTTQDPKKDGTIWFFVSSDGDVIDEVKANSQVNIAYAKEGNYVSVSGMASIVNDTEKKKELWYAELAKWFEGQSPESPDVVLIKVTADTARYWGENSGGSDKGKRDQAGGSGRIDY